MFEDNCGLVGLGRVCAEMNKNQIDINKNLNLSEEERRGIGGGYRGVRFGVTTHWTGDSWLRAPVTHRGHRASHT